MSSSHATQSDDRDSNATLSVATLHAHPRTAQSHRPPRVSFEISPKRIHRALPGCSPIIEPSNEGASPSPRLREDESQEQLLPPTLTVKCPKPKKKPQLQRERVIHTSTRLNRRYQQQSKTARYDRSAKEMRVHLGPQEVALLQQNPSRGAEQEMFRKLNQISLKDGVVLESLLKGTTQPLLSARSDQTAPIAKKISQAFLAKYIHDPGRKRQSQTMSHSPQQQNHNHNRHVSMFTNFKEELPPIPTTKASPRQQQQQPIQPPQEVTRGGGQFVPSPQLKPKPNQSKKVLRDPDAPKELHEPNYSIMSASGINFLGQNLIINSMRRGAGAAAGPATTSMRQTSYGGGRFTGLQAARRTMRHSYDVSPKQMKYENWVEQFPIKELEEVNRREVGISTHTPPDSGGFYERKRAAHSLAVQALKQSVMVLKERQAERLGKVTKQLRRKEMAIEKALKSRMQGIIDKPAQVKMLPPLRGIPLDREMGTAGGRSTSPKPIPQAAIYKKERTMRGGSGELLLDETQVVSQEVDATLGGVGAGVGSGTPFSLTSGQYYHRVNMMSNERRGSLLNEAGSRSPTSQFARKKRLQMSVQKIGTPVYNNAQRAIKAHSRPIRIPQLSVMLERELLQRSMDENYPSRNSSQASPYLATQESTAAGAGAPGGQLRNSYDEAINMILLDKRAKLEGWDEEDGRSRYDTLRILDVQDGFNH